MYLKIYSVQKYFKFFILISSDFKSRKGKKRIETEAKRQHCHGLFLMLLLSWQINLCLKLALTIPYAVNYMEFYLWIWKN